MADYSGPTSDQTTFVTDYDTPTTGDPEPDCTPIASGTINGGGSSDDEE